MGRDGPSHRRKQPVASKLTGGLVRKWRLGALHLPHIWLHVPPPGQRLSRLNYVGAGAVCQQIDHRSRHLPGPRSGEGLGRLPC